MSIYFGNKSITPRDGTPLHKTRGSTVSIVKDVKNSTLQEKYVGVNDDNYVCQLERDDILQHSVSHKDKRPTKLLDVVFLEFPSKRLSNISAIDLCERLVICNLSGNYLKDMSPLRWCVHLYYLDLHSNQLTCLPDYKCWEALKKLHVLYLHDNGIGKLEELKDLSHSPHLVHLTLYDTPISLKKNYRHCVVNAVWSLKALDFCVISDEEIIEDANFSQRFKPMQPHFKFKPFFLPSNEEGGLSFRTSILHIRRNIATVNKIQAKHCPVLVMQRVIRGHLIRMRYNYVMDTRLWAAISIQRCYRHFKGIPNPPPCTPLLHYNDFMYQSMSSIKLDYDAYVKMRRAMDPSIISFKSVNFRSDWRLMQDSRPVRKRISINLEKLIGMTTIVPKGNSNNVSPRESSNVTLELKSSEHHKYVRPSSAKITKHCPSFAEEYARKLGLNTVPSTSYREQQKIGKYFTQFKFLGKIEQPLFSESEMSISFRLSGHMPPVMQHEPLEELAIRTVEGAEDIRKAVKIIEKERKETIPEKLPRKKKAVKVSGMNLKSSSRGKGISFACFSAIDKAYRHRAKMEELEKKTSLVNQQRKMEEFSVEQVKAHNANMQNLALMREKKDRLFLLNALENRRQRELNALDKIDAQKSTWIDKHRKWKDEYQFAMDFSCQNASVSKALANHDRHSLRDKETQRKSELVDSLKGASERRRELVVNYLHDTKLSRLVENESIKKDLNDVISKQIAERLDGQITRVKCLRENKGTHMVGATVIPVKKFEAHVEEIKR